MGLNHFFQREIGKGLPRASSFDMGNKEMKRRDVVSFLEDDNSSKRDNRTQEIKERHEALPGQRVSERKGEGCVNRLGKERVFSEPRRGRTQNARIILPRGHTLNEIAEREGRKKEEGKEPWTPPSMVSLELCILRRTKENSKNGPVEIKSESHEKRRGGQRR